MPKHFVTILLLPDSPIILVFRHQGSLLNSDGFTPTEGAKYRRGIKWGSFWPISQCISEPVRDTAVVAIEVKWETIPKLSNGGTFDDLEWPPFNIQALCPATWHIMRVCQR